MTESLLNGIKRYSELILYLENDEDSNPYWLNFYEEQIKNWIISTKGSCSNLKKVHSVYKKIKYMWFELYFDDNNGNYSFFSDKEKIRSK